MKPKDLYIPIGQEVIIKDKMIFVPQRGEIAPFSFPAWSSSDLFENENPITIEYCSGNGFWILEKAKQHPNRNFIAVERQFLRARKIWAKTHNYGLSNVVVAWAEGMLFTSLCIQDASIEEVYVNFPDPWPKRRHAKNRIIKQPFIREMERIVRTGAHITLVTDDETYSAIMIQEMEQSKPFVSELPPPYYIEPPADYGTSFFDDLFRKKGKQIRFHRYIKK
jgi:tRNA (guanine-N7-)-methyltransferase